MKKTIKFIVEKILANRARGLLRRHRTQVIGVTGSVGKTSTKEAIYTILKDHFKTYRSAKGFNTDLGLALAVLQEEESGFSSPWQWLKILYRSFFGKKESYQKIVLEFGADHPGDIKKLLKIAKPKIGVVTSVSATHLGVGQFADVAAIAKEKNLLVKNMAISDVAILNYDDPLVQDMQTFAKKIYYGIDNPADIKAKNIQVSLKGIDFTVHYKNEQADFQVPVLGRFQASVLLPAIAVAVQLGISLQECAKSLEHFQLPPGRMSLIAGVNKSQILDSSYNASPFAIKAALELLRELPGKRKIAALGSMNELGEANDAAHHDTGALAAQYADILIAVGASAHLYKRGAMAAGMKESAVHTFLDAEEAGAAWRQWLEPKDLILVKGSQNRVRMERFTKMIMAQPEMASKLLCREEEVWNKIR